MEHPISGAIILLDEEDFRVLKGITLHASRRKNLVYACFNTPRPNRKSILAHRFLLGLAATDPRCVHFKNGNTLDLRRKNLEILTRAEMQQIRRDHKDSRGTKKSPFGGWAARIKINKKEVSLGHFPTKEEAHQAYITAKRQLQGL